MNLKSINKIMLAATVCAVFAAGPALAGKVTLKLGHLSNEETTWHKAAIKFGEEVKSLSNGRVVVKVYPNSSLGKEMDLVSGMQLGTVDMTITGESLQNWAPKAALLAVPYAYKTMEHMDSVASGKIGDMIEAQIIEKAKVRPLAYFARGPRNLTSNRPIKSPSDLNGLKLRVPNVPLFVDVWDSLGAKPTPMAFSEVFTSLQSNVIDAQENPLALIKSASFFEVQKFVNKTEHVRSWIYLALSEKTWSKLSEADKAAVTEAGKRAQAYERMLFLEESDKLVAELEAKGMTFVEVDGKAFASQAKEAVLKNVNAEIRTVVKDLFSS